MIEDDPSHVVFTDATRQEFLDQLQPSPYHITQEEKANIRDWLDHPERSPQSQTEYNRRGYVRKTFSWDEERQRLYAQGQVSKKNRRLKVKTVEEIADAIERCHRHTNHGGRAKTWRRVRKRYHGVLQPDVVWFLQRCEKCKAKYPKRSDGSMAKKKQKKKKAI